MGDASQEWPERVTVRHLPLAAIRAAAADVAADLLAGVDPAEAALRLPGLRVEVRLADGGAAEVMSSLAGGETYLFRVSALTDLAALTCHLADRLQDFVVENLRRAAPPCPSHPHPLEPDVLDGAAVWRCPTSSTWACPVGERGRRADATTGRDCDR